MKVVRFSTGVRSVIISKLMNKQAGVIGIWSMRANVMIDLTPTTEVVRKRIWERMVSRRGRYAAKHWTGVRKVLLV